MKTLPFLLLASVVLGAGCNMSATPAPTSPTRPVASAPSADEERAALLKVTPVVACEVLNKARVETAFTGKTFALRTERKVQTLVTEHLSACGWMTELPPTQIQTSADVEVRTFVTQAEADRFLERSYRTYAENGETLATYPELGPNAFSRTMTIYSIKTVMMEFLKGQTYFKLSVSMPATAESEIVAKMKLLAQQF